MAYIFTEIEKNKSWSIWAVFIFLILLYFIIAETAWGFLSIFSLIWGAKADLFSAQKFFRVLLVSFIFAMAHWVVSTSGIVKKILDVLDAKEPDPSDSYHAMLKNIVAEVSVATGGRMIKPYVISTAAVNAFAVSDFKGNAIIGVTEGLLAKLDRAQLEAVVGHEAAHIVSGDSLTTTVTCSLFGIYSALLDKIKVIIKNGSGGPLFLIVLSLLMVLLYIAQFINFLLNMFLSREKEYRADAIAVRLTRNPVALAEALYMISRNWRDVGSAADSLSPIFIVNPTYSMLDESEGIIANLFSTHPPMMRRIKILLSMAHSDIMALIESGLRDGKINTGDVPQVKRPVPRSWFIRKDGSWAGPFFAEELLSLGLTPASWVLRLGDENIRPAADHSDLSAILRDNIDQGLRRGVGMCPKCRQPLMEYLYEGVPVYGCYYCKGMLVYHDAVTRIIIRDVVGISDSARRLGEVILKNYAKLNISRKGMRLLQYFNCPKCGSKMVRAFYSMVYPVEVDRCFGCGYVWFDEHEMEVIQYLSEKIR